MNYLLIVVFTLIDLSCGRLAEETSLSTESCINFQCFHQAEDACPPVQDKCRCQRLKTCSQAVICCNVDEYLLTEGLACAGHFGLFLVNNFYCCSF